MKQYPENGIKVIVLGLIFVLIATNFAASVSISKKMQAQETTSVKVSSDIKEPEVIEHTYQFPLPTFKQENDETIFTVEDCTLSCKPGEPTIPIRTATLLLPPNTDAVKIEVTPDKKLVWPSTYRIPPAQEAVPLCYQGEIQATPPNQAIYNSLDPYPGKTYEIVSVQQKLGFTLLIINLFPLQYVPKTGAVYSYSTFNVRITLSSINRQLNDVMPARMTLEDIQQVKSIVDNPEVVSVYQDHPPQNLEKTKTRSLVDPAESYQYVIITNQELKDATGDYTFQDLIQSKINKGLTATIVTVEDIEACPDYWWNGVFGDGAPLFNDTACHIRNFIKDAYYNWETKYVLLGGDGDYADVGGESGDNIIPARGLYDALFGYQNSSLSIASDLYYSCLDGSFNSDQDAFWGEPTDGPNGQDVDLLSEVYVGRAPVDSSDEVSNFVRKTLAYENSQDDYLQNVLMVGEYLGFGGLGDYGGNYKDEIIEGSDHNGYSTVGIPQIYNISTLYDRDWPGHDWPKTELLNRINAGVHIINHLGHGNNYHVMKLDEPVFMRRDPETGKEVFYGDCHDVVENMTNNQFFFMYSQACYAGSFDNRNAFPPYGHGECLPYDSIVETLVTAEHGAFACVANTRFGLGMRFSTDGPTQHFDREFFDAMFAENKRELGIANQDSKEDNIGLVNLMQMRYCYYEITLFGDPELSIKPDHNIGVTNIETPDHVHTSDEIIVNATLMNNGRYNETDVAVSLLINNEIVSSTTIPIFNCMSSQDVQFTWTTSGAGVYTISVAVSATSGGDILADNEKSRDVYVGVLNRDTNKCFNTIQEALDDSETLAGHTIIAPRGLYDENIVITKGVILQGAGKESTIIDGGYQGNVVQISGTSSATLSEFTITNGVNGILTASTISTTIQDLIVTNQGDAGIKLMMDSGTVITRVTLANNKIGIQSESTDTAIISENEIIENVLGVSFDAQSYGNLIYHNNLNNTKNAIDNSTENFWNSSYLDPLTAHICGGNWWADDLDEDSMKGPEQNIPGSDGIRDHPYPISGLGENQDFYPLTNQWTGSFTMTIQVDDDADPGWYDATHVQSIQEGITIALSGDTVLVHPGTYHEFVIIDKSLTLKGEEKNTTIIQGPQSGNVITVFADNVIITGLTVIGEEPQLGSYDSGIALYSCNNQIIGNSIRNTAVGIGLWGTSGCSISSNQIDGGKTSGIYLQGSSGNTVTANQLVAPPSGLFGIYGGIYIGQSSNENTVSGNTIDTYNMGIWVLLVARHNVITENRIINSSSYGMLLNFDGSLNVITDNLIAKNRLIGIYLWPDPAGAFKNHIFHNDFVLNGVNANDSAWNYWDDGYPSGGNYWSDYAGIDQFSGPDQNLPGSDGIGDTPYLIPSYQGETNQDRYPLMNSCTPLDFYAFAYGSYYNTFSQTVAFKGAAIGGTPPYTWNWSFGNGVTSDEQNPEYRYGTTGTYTVVLTVTDSQGQTATDLTIAMIEEDITVEAGPPCQTIPGVSISFYGYATGGFRIHPTAEDPQYWYNWHWDFDDGNVSYEQATNHVYTRAGMYYVNLTVTDFFGNTASDTRIIIIQSDTVFVDDDYNEATPGWGFDHFCTIQGGVDTAADGGTVKVSSGFYTEHVTINKHLLIMGEDPETTIIDGAGSGSPVTITVWDGCTLDGFTLQHSGTDGYGLFVHGGSSGSIIRNNIIEENQGHAVYLQDSALNVFRGNRIAISGDSYAFYLTGDICLNNDVDLSNTVNGVSSILMLANVETPTTIENMHAVYQEPTRVSNYGMITFYLCKNITISHCELTNNVGNGVYVYHSSLITFSDNIITNNQLTGILFSGISNSIIQRNTIEANGGPAIQLQYKWGTYSCGNTIVENTLVGNSIGVYVPASGNNNNKFYHNNFINNTVNAYDKSNNYWDNGYPSGGNYWNGILLPDMIPGDGIGDEQITIPGKSSPNIDHYPLIHRFVRGDMNTDGLVNFGDINPFVVALTNPTLYQNTYHLLPSLHGDINQDGSCNFGDINPFVALLSNG